MHERNQIKKLFVAAISGHLLTSCSYFSVGYQVRFGDPVYETIGNLNNEFARLSQEERILFSVDEFGEENVICVEPPLSAPESRHLLFALCMSYASKIISKQEFLETVREAVASTETKDIATPDDTDSDLPKINRESFVPQFD